MNLHRLGPREFWIWSRAQGGNGTRMGTHLWPYIPSPPPMPDPAIMPDHAWSSPWQIQFRRLQRYNPFDRSYEVNFQHGWTRPLCGKRSQSRQPFATWLSPLYINGVCRDCERAANERGIRTYCYANVLEVLPQWQEYQQMLREIGRMNV